jgi:hypothetical protein
MDYNTSKTIKKEDIPKDCPLQKGGILESLIKLGFPVSFFLYTKWEGI